MKKILNATSEFSIGDLRAHRCLCRTVAGVSSFLMLATFSAPALAAGTSVLGGDAVLTGATRAALDTGSATDSYAQFVADAGSKSAVLDWSKFNIGAGKEMNFNGAGTTFFNLVDGAASKSQIDGLISGNGSVWVINPSGIAFGANSQVNVGGTFAAAAGNISNADALRDGTATLPTFSSFDGSVSSASGSKFAADQVALMGKTVSAAGDFTGAKALTVAASSGAMTVDDVGGGKVSVNLGDFTVADAEVSLGDLDVGGSLSVKSAGAIASASSPTSAGSGRPMLLTTTKTGEKIQADDISFEAYDDLEVDGKLQSTAGNVSLLSYGKIDVNSEVDAYGSVSATAQDEINVAADVTARNGNVILSTYDSLYINDGATVSSKSESGVVSIYGSYGISGKGNVEAAGNLEMQTDLGDINIEGIVKAKDADFKVDEYMNNYYLKNYGYEYRGGSLFLENKGNDFTGKFTAQAGVIKVRDANDITLGNVTAYLDYGDTRIGEEGRAITVYACDGTLTVDKEATVEANGWCTTLALAAGTGTKIDDHGNLVPVTGNVVIDGVVRADVPRGEIDIFTGTGAGGANGDITINGEVSAVGRNNAFSSQYSSSGIEIASAYMKGSSGNVIISKGAVVSSDAVTSDPDHPLATFISAGDGWGYDESLGNYVEYGANGYVDIAGTIKGGDHVTVKTYDGDITIGKDADLTIEKSGEITIVSAAKDGGSGNITVDGSISADVDGGMVLIESGHGKKSFGNIEISGDVFARKTVFAEAGGGEGSSGNLTLKSGASFVAGTDDGEKARAALYTGSGKISVEKESVVSAKGNYGKVNAVAGFNANSEGTVDISGSLTALGHDGVVNVLASYGTGSSGSMSVSGRIESDLASFLTTGNGNINVAKDAVILAQKENGKVELDSATHDGAVGDIRIAGKVMANGTEAQVYIDSAKGDGSRGNVVINGDVHAGKQAIAYAGFGESSVGSVQVAGNLSAGEEVGVLTRDGAITIGGVVDSGDAVKVIAGVNGGKGGDVVFAENGKVVADKSVEIQTSNGDVIQNGTDVAITADGFVEAKSFRAAIEAPEVNFNVNGNLGNGAKQSVAVSGTVYGQISGDASLSAANGDDFPGGVKPSQTPSVSISAEDAVAATVELSDGGLDINTTPSKQSLAVGVDWGDADDNSSIMANGDLSIYTAGKLNPYGLLYAGGDLTISASSFGDMSYLRAGGTLTINNVGKPAYPQIAYFETVNGVEPTINNQPNDTVIFVDGRLAGGNLKILNQFGANEAFMVSTPELKSTQGIFGNPTFLHSDLDVANPMEVSAIDYMLQETPRLTLDKDFPTEVDSHVDSVVVPEKDSIQFGRGTKDEAAAESDEKVAETVTADGKVALAK